MGKIYRAVEAFPANASDFLSDIEAERTTKRSDCKNWGCSVWQDRVAVDHARDNYPRFQQSFIVFGDLDPSAGQVLATPSRPQPGHATFWKIHDLDVSGAFEKVLDPIPTEQDDPLGPT
ncbi:hypothetical protein AB8A28_19860 [Tardiphaga sp. 71_E8_N1_1]|uniref:hypothetical protein n=1 Tax=Tardiphaga sp. 71_E8_N1_1 TaxID=3240784 RepID=UPI003F8ABB18